MSLHQFYNRSVSTAPFIGHFCSVCSFVFHFCCMNLDSVVFQTTRITFPAVGYRRFYFFVYNLLLTSPSFIRIQFKTLKLVFVISYFYKAFVQFSSHSTEQILKHFLNYSASRRKSLLYFFPGAFNIKLVNSFILVWHSDYELSSKTQKSLFILKESFKCHNINYRTKNHVAMFCFGL